MEQNKKSKIDDVINRIQKSKNIPLPLKGKLIDKLIRKHDLDLEESKLVYDDVDFGDEFKLFGRKPVDIDWSNHAEFRSELRDVNPNEMNKFVEKEMMNKLQHNDLKGDERIKEPGVGTAVVDYNLRKPEVKVVTVWANIKKGEIMDYAQQKIIGQKYGKLIASKIKFDMDDAVAFSANAILTSLLYTIENNEEVKEYAFIKRLAKFRTYLSKFYKSKTKKQLTLNRFKSGIASLQKYTENDIITIFLSCYNLLEICGVVECSEVAGTLVPFAKMYAKKDEKVLVSSNKQADIVADYLKSCGTVHEALGKIIDKLISDKKYIQSMGAISDDVEKIDKMIDEIAKAELIVKRNEDKMKNQKLLVSE